VKGPSVAKRPDESQIKSVRCDGELQNPDSIDIQRSFINVMDEYVSDEVLHGDECV